MRYPEKCHLCTSQEVRFIESVRYLDVNCVGESEDLEEMTSHYFVCESCGTVFQSPLPLPDEMIRYFKTTQIQDPEILFLSKKELFLNRMQFLQEHTGLTAGRVVEVGCREGNFLKLLKEKLGFDVYGIDPSAHAGSMAQEINHVPISNTTLESLDLKAQGLYEAFDLALVMHALEYVFEPYKFLKQLVNLVKPSGFLYLEVPSLGHPYEDLLCGRYIFRQQLSHFTAAGLTNLLKGLGITVVEQSIDRGFSYPSYQLLGQKMSYADAGRQSFLRELDNTNRRYIEAGERLKYLLNNYQKVVLWGVGFDLHRIMTLMPETVQPDRLILVDENPNKQGKRLLGIPIVSSSSINSPVAVAITPSPESIRWDIRKDIEAKFPDTPYFELFSNTPVNLKVSSA